MGTQKLKMVPLGTRSPKRWPFWEQCTAVESRKVVPWKFLFNLVSGPWFRAGEHTILGGGDAAGWLRSLNKLRLNEEWKKMAFDCHYVTALVKVTRMPTWMVVEWIPSLWKNSFTRSATVMYWAKFRQRTYQSQTNPSGFRSNKYKVISTQHQAMIKWHLFDI